MSTKHISPPPNPAVFSFIDTLHVVPCRIPMNPHTRPRVPSMYIINYREILRQACVTFQCGTDDPQES